VDHTFLRTEAKARKANDDGIWELLEEAADEIDRLRSVALVAMMSAGHSQTEIQQALNQD
jgi:hypothetical protein